jgi:undecaprenyl diphosphate synthase
MELFEQIDKTRVPQHIAIIMDGNGRWAKQQGEERLYGHTIGVESVRAALKAATKTGVNYLTLYTFSTENWNRPKDEVDGLMNLLVQTLSNELDELNQNNVRLTTIGDIEGLPAYCVEELENIRLITSKNTGIQLILALNYSARWELTNATKQIVEKIVSNNLSISAINDQLISDHLTTVGIPDPELLVRTSGEQRISNFLLWQIAYTEFYYTEVLWPDFREDDLYLAILDYQSRERRFGKTSEQLTS